jgi:hypothetical protein
MVPHYDFLPKLKFPITRKFKKAHQKSHADKIDHYHRDPSIDEYHVRHFGLYDCLAEEDQGQESSSQDRGANVKLSQSI